MKIAILDAGTLGDDLDLGVFARFGEVVTYNTTDPDEMKARLADAECAVVNKVKMNENTVGGAEKLRLICIAATGYDNVDLEYMKKRGIAVCNVVGYSTDSVAQLTLSMALSLATHLPEYTGFVKSGEYSESAVANRLTPVYHELCGKTWGVVGLGNIGRRVAKIAGAIGCRVIANKRTPDNSFECVDIDTLCRTADIISVHTPLNAQTCNLISAERIALMKNNTIVINVARGAVCDEAALCRAVAAGEIGALGVDVYTTEPFGCDSPYFDVRHLENVCLTPHMAWGSYEARVRCINDMARSIDAFVRGERRSRLV